jgi:hypothetical protein
LIKRALIFTAIHLSAVAAALAVRSPLLDVESASPRLSEFASRSLFALLFPMLLTRHWWPFGALPAILLNSFLWGFGLVPILQLARRWRV